MLSDWNSLNQSQRNVSCRLAVPAALRDAAALLSDLRLESLMYEMLPRPPGCVRMQRPLPKARRFSPFFSASGGEIKAPLSLDLLPVLCLQVVGVAPARQTATTAVHKHGLPPSPCSPANITKKLFDLLRFELQLPKRNGFKQQSGNVGVTGH